MKSQPRLFCILSFLFFATKLLAQDLIIRTDGSRIFCRITKIDTASIFYMRARDKSEQQIARESVEKYYVAQAKAPLKINSDKVIRYHEVFVLSALAGRSLPMGKFSAKDLNESTSGFALDGYLLGGNVTLKIIKEFGLSLSYLYQVNRFDQKKISDALNDVYPNGGFTAEATPWKMRGFFLGFLLNLGIRPVEGLSIKIEAKAGFPLFIQPEIKTRGTLNGQRVGIDSSGDPARSVAFNPSFGLIFKVSRNVALSLDIDGFFAKPYFVGKHKNLFGYSQSYSFEQPYRTITPRAGICLLFGTKKTP